MSWFKNNSNKQNDLKLDDYNNATKTQKFAAFLIAVGTMLITIVICFGLFFATRWTYRKIAGNDQNSDTSSTQSDESEEETTDVTTIAPKQTSNQVMPVSSSSQSVPQTPNKKVPNTGPEIIPNTGPESEE